MTLHEMLSAAGILVQCLLVAYVWTIRRKLYPAARLPILLGLSLMVLRRLTGLSLLHLLELGWVDGDFVRIMSRVDKALAPLAISTCLLVGFYLHFSHARR